MTDQCVLPHRHPPDDLAAECSFDVKTRSDKQASIPYPDLRDNNVRVLLPTNNELTFVERKVLSVSKPTQDGFYTATYNTPTGPSTYKLSPDQLFLYLDELRSERHGDSTCEKPISRCIPCPLPVKGATHNRLRSHRVVARSRMRHTRPCLRASAYAKVFVAVDQPAASAHEPILRRAGFVTRGPTTHAYCRVLFSDQAGSVREGDFHISELLVDLVNWPNAFQVESSQEGAPSASPSADLGLRLRIKRKTEGEYTYETFARCTRVDGPTADAMYNITYSVNGQTLQAEHSIEDLAEPLECWLRGFGGASAKLPSKGLSSISNDVRIFVAPSTAEPSADVEEHYTTCKINHGPDERGRVSVTYRNILGQEGTEHLDMSNFVKFMSSRRDKASHPMRLRVRELEQKLKVLETERSALQERLERAEETGGSPFDGRRRAAAATTFDYSSSLPSPAEVARSLGRLSSILFTSWVKQARKSWSFSANEAGDDGAMGSAVGAIRETLIWTARECFKHVENTVKKRMDSLDAFLGRTSGTLSYVDDSKRTSIARGVFRENYRDIFAEFHPSRDGPASLASAGLVRELFESIPTLKHLTEKERSYFWDKTHNAYEKLVLGLMQTILACRIHMPNILHLSEDSVGSMAMWDKVEHERESCDPYDDQPLAGKTRIQIVLPRLYSEMVEGASTSRNWLTRASFFVVED